MTIRTNIYFYNIKNRQKFKPIKINQSNNQTIKLISKFLETKLLISHLL